MTEKNARKKENENAALAGVGFNILMMGFVAEWLDFFPDGMTGSILRLSVMSLALSFFIVGLSRNLTTSSGRRCSLSGCRMATAGH